MEAFEEPKPLLNYLIKPVPRTGGDLSRPLGRVPRFFVDIYVAAVHRSLLRPNHRTICNEKLAILRFAKRIRPNNIPQTGILTNPSISNRAQTRASSSRREECEEREREERRTTHFSFPLRRYSSPQHLNTVAAPTLPFLSVPCRSGSLLTHTYTHTRTRIYTWRKIAGAKRRRDSDREGGERERKIRKDTAPRCRTRSLTAD